MEENVKLIKAENDQTNMDDSEIKSFFCSSCEYCTNDKSNYNKHLNTTKHQNSINIKVKLNKSYVCEYCQVEFNNRTSCWRHKKQCDSYIESKKETISVNNTAIYTNNTINNDIINDDKNVIHNESNVIQLLLDLTKKVQTIEQQLSEQNNHIKELKNIILNKSIKV